MLLFLQQRAATHLTVDSSILCARRPSLFDSGKTGCQTTLPKSWVNSRAFSSSSNRCFDLLILIWFLPVAWLEASYLRLSAGMVSKYNASFLATLTNAWPPSLLVGLSSDFMLSRSSLAGVQPGHRGHIDLILKGDLVLPGFIHKVPEQFMSPLTLRLSPRPKVESSAYLTMERTLVLAQHKRGNGIP